MYNIIEFKELDSTNTYAKNNISLYKDGDVIYALRQTSGHGRMARAWSDSEGNIAFSIIYKDKFVLDNFSSLSLISAVGVYDTLTKYINGVSLKWPNDVLVNGKKISGILMEAVSYNELEGLVLGIGINVNNKSFPENLNATSVYLESGQELNKKEFLVNVLSSIEKFIYEAKKGNNEYLKIFRKNNYLLNKEMDASINNQIKKVKIIDILDDNRILVECNGNKIALSSGELSFHKETK